MVQSTIMASVSGQQKMSNDWNSSNNKVYAEKSPKYDQQKKSEDTSKKNVDSKYGAWGPTFKNKTHFSNLHQC